MTDATKTFPTDQDRREVTGSASQLIKSRWTAMPVPTDARFLVLVCRELLERRQAEAKL